MACTDVLLSCNVVVDDFQQGRGRGRNGTREALQTGAVERCPHLSISICRYQDGK